LLKPLGPWGVFVASFVDSASVPLPIDIMLAATGSALGGLVPFFVGRAGGELFLLRYVNRARFEALRDRFEKQEFLAVMVPSLLPPPVTWKLFVFGAGVFEMRTVNFLLAVWVGRIIRFGVETALTVIYGPQIVSVLGTFAKQHFVLAMLLLVVIFVALGWWIWSKLKGKPAAKAETPAE
jgi:membrane protein YqaA with SNARE-associated domain